MSSEVNNNNKNFAIANKKILGMLSMLKHNIAKNFLKNGQNDKVWIFFYFNLKVAYPCRLSCIEIARILKIKIPTL
jgi:hypothetical protein